MINFLNRIQMLVCLRFNILIQTHLSFILLTTTYVNLHDYNEISSSRYSILLHLHTL